MDQHTRSFAYTRDVLRSLTAQARAEVARLGGNRGVEAILDRLVVNDGQEPVLETAAAAAAEAATMSASRATSTGTAGTPHRP